MSLTKNELALLRRRAKAAYTGHFYWRPRDREIVNDLIADTGSDPNDFEINLLYQDLYTSRSGATILYLLRTYHGH